MFTSIDIRVAIRKSPEYVPGTSRLNTVTVPGSPRSISEQMEAEARASERESTIVYEALTPRVLLEAFSLVERWDMRVDRIVMSHSMYRDLVQESESRTLSNEVPLRGALFGVEVDLVEGDRGYVEGGAEGDEYHTRCWVVPEASYMADTTMFGV